MQRFFAVLTVLLVATGSVGAPVAAQAQGANATTTTANVSATNATNQVMMDLGSSVTLVGWRYDGDRMHVKLRADVPTRVSVTDAYAGLSSGGVTAVPSRSVTIHGTRTVVIDTAEFRGESAVSVGAEEVARISTGAPVVGNPFAGGSPTAGWVGGAVLAVGMFVAAGAYVLRKEGGEPKVADS